jgi:cysteine synthase A
MGRLGLERGVVDRQAYQGALKRLGEAGVVLPTFSQLADPATIPPQLLGRLKAVDRDAPDAANLFRVHWHNQASGPGLAAVPEHVVLPSELTGVEAPIAVALGDRFPLIGAHKVLAAYACLVARLVTGQFDPTWQRAVWPSTGNYARGGVAISRMLGCRGVAVLPQGMSRERFEWLESWVVDPAEDIVRTPGSESNVKEIYDACARLARDPSVVVLNQFCELPNHLAHFGVTGPALERIYGDVARERGGIRLAGFVAASGSAGTLAAGDYLGERHGSLTVVVEALQCPTLLYNGYGEHNIQGIGDKHVPLIHNVMATDVVTAVSDASTDALSTVLGSDVGRSLLAERGVREEVLDSLGSFGLSSIANVLASIKVAKHFGLGPHDLVVTVATDGARLYASERRAVEARLFPGGLDRTGAAAALARHLDGVADDHLLELTAIDRKRIFNLGYFTWVEQQGVPLEDFEARRDPGWWRGLRGLLAAWDELIGETNALAGAGGGT